MPGRPPSIVRASRLAWVFPTLALVAAALFLLAAADPPRPERGRVVPATCGSNADCPNTEPVCTAGSCGPCSNSNECNVGSDTICNDEAGACVECQVGSDCAPPNTLCTPNGVCVECFTSGDCSGDTPICNGSSDCVACTSSPQCSASNPNAPYCNTGTGA